MSFSRRRSWSPATIGVSTLYASDCSNCFTTRSIKADCEMERDLAFMLREMAIPKANLAGPKSLMSQCSLSYSG